MRTAVCAVVLTLALFLTATAEAATPTLRIGVLKFGSVSWELDVIVHHGLDRAEGISIEQVELASTPATQVALQAGRVDAIVSDWLWVSRQRASGADWTFFPFSTAVGSLVVPATSPIHSLADLDHRRLGVAGSSLDKSWLILRLLARRHGVNLEEVTEKSFGAPPLLEAELLAGRLDAVLTYWQSVARLEAKGLRQVLSVSDALRALGIETKVPMVGYVVSAGWAKANPAILAGFLRASRRAREILAISDAEWDRLSSRVAARDEAELHHLRDTFRAGIPKRWDEAERHDAVRLYDLLATVGGPALVGPSKTLAPGTFLDTVRY